jgi:uncharacterized membrane protein YphA (DoxX/SURF4 family)
MTSIRRTWWPWISIAARLLVGIVWILAGVLKLEDVEDSVRSVRNFDLLPEALVRPVGTGLPVLEIIVGALLIVGLGLRVSGALSALLQLAFIIGIAAAWARGLEIECGCFGGSGSLATSGPGAYTSQYKWDILRDAGLFVLSVLIAVWPRSRLSLDDVLLPQPDDEE